MTSGEPTTARRKPTIRQLGIDLADLDWQRSGTGAGSLEVAFVGGRGGQGGRSDSGGGGDSGGGDQQDGASADWVLLRIAEDPAGRVLVYDRTEWACFLDGVGRGEFG
ncbi:MAG TPA: DUF397 domain-containing protein [Streptosporangiaceae bacterium]|nr:DUF397 domain-containing protein [Streptosporangiaceae bacterium]